VTTLRRARLLAAWLLGIYLAGTYVRMGWGELETDGLLGGSLTRLEQAPWLLELLGGIEVLGGAALVIPRLATYGGFVLSIITAVAWGSLAHEHRWTDVARLTWYTAALTWIAYEWLCYRVGRDRAPLASRACIPSR
jgi:uncharacterized membrane protein YphA (DoxX/SURF4 family)